MSDQPGLVYQNYHAIAGWVTEARQRSGGKTSAILRALGVAPSTYYRAAFRQRSGGLTPLEPVHPPRNPFAVLPEEIMLALDCALTFPEYHHRELAWRMTDAGVLCLSPSTFYRILVAHGLVPQWSASAKYEVGAWRRDQPTVPDEKWLTDPTCIRVSGRWWYLVYFIDEYSRYIVSWDLLSSLDEQAIQRTLDRALAVPGRVRKPTIQTDNGPAFISADFRRYMEEQGMTHVRIRPHQPTDNGVVERMHRTEKEMAGDRYEDESEARRVIGRTIEYYNHDRRHSALNYLRPADYYRGNPSELLEQRARNQQAAREHRKRVNLRLTSESRRRD